MYGQVKQNTQQFGIKRMYMQQQNNNTSILNKFSLGMLFLLKKLVSRHFPQHLIFKIVEMNPPLVKITKNYKKQRMNGKYSS